MGRWNNFTIWKGKLPHWRADDVHYYVTFRHRRPLTENECQILFSTLLKPQGKKWDVDILCVLPEKTELIVTVDKDPSGESFELSDIVEKAKSKAGKLIVKKSGERYPPFYFESYDRIMRDDEETEVTWQSIADSPQVAELAESSDEYQFLFILGAP